MNFVKHSVVRILVKYDTKNIDYLFLKYYHFWIMSKKRENVGAGDKEKRLQKNVLYGFHLGLYYMYYIKNVLYGIHNGFAYSNPPGSNRT